MLPYICDEIYRVIIYYLNLKFIKSNCLFNLIVILMEEDIALLKNEHKKVVE